MPKYTGFENVRITGELVVEGGVQITGLTVDGVDDITPPAKAAGSSYTKAEIDAIVDAVNGILALQGKSSG